jgi:enoyl-CoA hydratase/carnithine racemase
MPTVTQVLSLRPDDLTAMPPIWEPGIPAGELGIAVIDGTAQEWEAAASELRDGTRELAWAPLVTVGVVRDGDQAARRLCLLAGCDLIVGRDGDASDVDGEVERLVGALTDAGAPALIAAQVLRAGENSTVALESLAYSTLLWSDDFRAWRDSVERHTAGDGNEPRVALARSEGCWRLTLTRPSRHNAFDSRMREELCDALDVIAGEPPLPVVLSGEGASFCSGGDLGEFGTAASPASAHVIRCGRSVARRLLRLSGRLVAAVQGSCIGAGVEFAAFAGTVLAAADAVFSLPELWLGLNLGAGGSISIPARIGRHRTLELLLAREPIDARRALQWGLVDRVVDAGELEQACAEAVGALA